MAIATRINEDMSRKLQVEVRRRHRWMTEGARQEIDLHGTGEPRSIWCEEGPTRHTEKRVILMPSTGGRIYGCGTDRVNHVPPWSRNGPSGRHGRRWVSGAPARSWPGSLADRSLFLMPNLGLALSPRGRTERLLAISPQVLHDPSRDFDRAGQPEQAHDNAKVN